MSDLETRTGNQLYDLLPEVYRSRDDGSLAAWMDGMGHVLDLVRNTLEQRLADCFPDAPLRGRASQDWLLPYFADLLEPHMISSDPRGQRAEVANAIAWRQRKGTVAVAEQVAQEVGQIEVEVQEGWKRVAVTPRIGGTPPPPPPMEGEPWAEGPAGTVAFGFPSRAVRVEPEDPAARLTRFGDQWIPWRQAHASGTPAFPGSYEDVSARTVDMRSPDWRRGHAHPRRLLLYYPPPTGFFPPGAARVAWSTWSQALATFNHWCGTLESSGGDQVSYVDPADGKTVTYEKAPHPQGLPFIRSRKGSLVLGERITALDGEQTTRLLLNGRWLERIMQAGADTVFRADGPPPAITGDVGIGSNSRFLFENLSFLGTVRIAAGSRLKLRNAAAKEIISLTADVQEPVVDIRDSMVEQISAPGGLLRLEHSTVMGNVGVARLQVSDCLFVSHLSNLSGSTQLPSVIRYSRLLRLPEGAPVLAAFNTTEPPLFVELDFQEDVRTVRRAARFGEPGAGVLHPEAPRAIRLGAEDGGEMGAFHGRRYSLTAEAVRNKLEDYLPVGVEAVLIPDPLLLNPPPALAE